MAAGRSEGNDQELVCVCFGWEEDVRRCLFRIPGTDYSIQSFCRPEGLVLFADRRTFRSDCAFVSVMIYVIRNM